MSFLSWFRDNNPEYQAQLLAVQNARMAQQQAMGRQSAQAKLIPGLPDPTTNDKWQPPISVPSNISNYAQTGDVFNPGNFFDPSSQIVQQPGRAQPLMGQQGPQPGGLLGGPEQFKQYQQSLLNQANPDQAMQRMQMAPALEGMSPEQKNAFMIDPTKAADAYTKTAFPAVPDKLQLLKGLQAKIDQFGPGTPEAKPYEDALASENIAVTNAAESARSHKVTEAETAAHNRATEANADWVETKDSMNNPLLINKKTFEAKRPDGSQADASEAVGPVAKMIANYDLAPLSSVAMLKPYGQQVMAEVAKQNPDYDAKFFNSAKSAKQSFASGKNGQGVRMANSGTSHLLTLEALGDALDNGDVKAVNELKNMISTQFGGVEISGYEAAAKVVGDEINKFISGGPGAQDDRAAYAKTLSAAKGTAARKAAIDALKGLMVGQLHSYKRQYETETRSKDFGDKLEPQVLALLENQQYAPGRNPMKPVGTTGVISPDIQKLIDQYAPK